MLHAHKMRKYWFIDDSARVEREIGSSWSDRLTSMFDDRFTISAYFPRRSRRRSMPDDAYRIERIFAPLNPAKSVITVSKRWSARACPLLWADDRWSLTVQHRGPLYHGPVLFRSFSFVARFPGEYIPECRIKNVNSENRTEKQRWRRRIWEWNLVAVSKFQVKRTRTSYDFAKYRKMES